MKKDNQITKDVEELPSKSACGAASCSAYGEKYGKAALIESLKKVIYESERYMESISVEELGNCSIFLTQSGDFYISALGQDVELEGAWTLSPLELAKQLVDGREDEDIVGALEEVIDHVKQLSIS